MKTFHLIRNLNDLLAREVVTGAPAESEDAVLLLHDAVFETFPKSEAKVFACREDLSARGIESPHAGLSHEEIARMITEYDRTIVW